MSTSLVIDTRPNIIPAHSQISGTEIVREVMIDRDASGSLGLSIAGGMGSPLGDVPIIIASMQYDGAAARTGKLTVSIKSGT